ncbi:MAG: hypothetical protein GY926_18885 [bacterium]|nr:hypothetical protein [bacterium]MCP4967284.1 hypothetical protein [bacterium]
MRKCYRPLLPLIALGLLVTACDDIGLIGGEQGSGNLTTDVRDVTPFSEIDVSSAVTVDLTVDPTATHSVIVTYDDNLIDNLRTRVDGDTLIVELQGSVNLTGGADRLVQITMPEVVGIEVSGASGVTATGPAAAYRLDASGASRVDLRNLEAFDVELDISGASDVDVYATGTVSGSASGASNLSVYGKPASVLVDSSGASDVDIEN